MHLRSLTLLSAASILVIACGDDSTSTSQGGAGATTSAQGSGAKSTGNTGSSMSTTNGPTGATTSASANGSGSSSTGSMLGPNDGHVGPAAELDLETYPIYSIDMSLEDYDIHYNGVEVGTGTSEHHADGWWDGGAFSRMTPPTEDGLERGLAVRDLFRGATLPIQDFNLRFEWRGGPDYAGFTGSGSKFLIVHTRTTLTEGDAQRRPMLFIAHVDDADDPADHRPNTAVFGPGQGIVPGYGNLPYAETEADLSYWVTNPQSFYMGNHGDIDSFLGAPVFEIDETLTIEYRVVSIATATHPRGLIAFRAYRRNGDVFERGIPWNWDENVDLGAYVTEVQQFGMGQFNEAPEGGPGIYTDVGGYVTVARDFNGWLGPRAGFVQR